MTFSLLILFGGLVLLFIGGEAVVRGSASLGLRLGITPMVTGLTVVAFGTSAPELMVSMQAALSGEGGLAVGNVVGSNICNIGLILGISTLIRPAVIDSSLVRRDVPTMIASGLVVAGLLLNGVLSIFEGSLLVIAMLAHIAYTVKSARAAKRAVREEFEHAVPEDTLSTQLSILVAVIGLAVLLLGGKVFVQGAVAISTNFGVAPAVIGLSIAAIGTSLPELATSVVAAVRGYGDMAAGNVIGSNIFNSLSVLGLTAVVTPLSLGGVGIVDLAVMVLASFVGLRLMSAKTPMRRWEGGVLVTGFAAYMVWLFI